MQIIGPITFDEVRTRFRLDHPATRVHEANTNQDADSALRLADTTFGMWSTVRLSRTDIRSVLLPWHLSEGGGRELVPRSGLTVGQAADLLRAHETEFTAANPVCSAKLTRFRTSPFTSVYLTTRPVPHDHYAGLPTGDGLVHLDGLHRLLGWELAGRLSPHEELTAYIAGDLTPLARAAGSDSAPNATTGGLRP
ncbi:DUF6309 family protein [Streptomyces sp. SP18CS02]|uniref:DUF6309 family protein n=1 Tax=Streptomyces sp. SP18CS02 TaxID=3002531 RepID=UPI002E774FF4|nr:DUF6309 family protein [Streptomyces sp. SP18CS02]MEE1752722.1 DUF6309 family protein [Streptomyces sp. SP18CS02]